MGGETGERGVRGRNIVAGLTDRNIDIALFLAMFSLKTSSAVLAYSFHVRIFYTE